MKPMTWERKHGRLLGMNQRMRKALKQTRRDLDHSMDARARIKFNRAELEAQVQTLHIRRDKALTQLENLLDNRGDFPEIKRNAAAREKLLDIYNTMNTDGK